jgi:hypothetical protein
LVQDVKRRMMVLLDAFHLTIAPRRDAAIRIS